MPDASSTTQRQVGFYTMPIPPFLCDLEEISLRKEIALLVHEINTRREIQQEELRNLHIILEATRLKLKVLREHGHSYTNWHEPRPLAIENIAKVNQNEAYELAMCPVQLNHRKDFLGIQMTCDRADIQSPSSSSANSASTPSVHRFKKKRSSKGKISKTDLRVSTLPPIATCKKENCCPNKCHTLTKDIQLQQRLRDDYCNFVRENDHQAGNEYLSSFLSPNQGRTKVNPSDFSQLSDYTVLRTFSYSVPHINANNEKDGYLNLCVSTFQSLYGLSSDRLTAIRKTRTRVITEESSYSNQNRHNMNDETVNTLSLLGVRNQMENRNIVQDILFRQRDNSNVENNRNILLGLELERTLRTYLESRSASNK